MHVYTEYLCYMWETNPRLRLMFNVSLRSKKNVGAPRTFNGGAGDILLIFDKTYQVLAQSSITWHFVCQYLPPQQQLVHHCGVPPYRIFRIIPGKESWKRNRKSAEGVCVSSLWTYHTTTVQTNNPSLTNSISSWSYRYREEYEDTTAAVLLLYIQVFCQVCDRTGY